MALSKSTCAEAGAAAEHDQAAAEVTNVDLKRLHRRHPERIGGDVVEHHRVVPGERGDRGRDARRRDDGHLLSGRGQCLDEVGGAASPLADGVGADGEEQNPPLPDWGPTDGVHGTDAETGASGTEQH